MKWLNTHLNDKNSRDKLKKEFRSNKPFPHLLIKNFLNEESAKKLAEALKKEKFEEKDSDLFQFRQTADLAYSKNKTIKEFYEFLRSKEAAEVIEGVSGIKLNIGKIDLAGSLYISTDYLLCHDDELQGRKIAYILYLCENFEDKDGGALALLEDKKGKPGRVKRRYHPQWNSLMIFEVSQKSWHEVEEVINDGKERYAIGGWFH